MKALVYTANERLEILDQPDPVVSQGDALVAIEAVGICGSDMHAYMGHDERRVPPLILGHEAAGAAFSTASERPDQQNAGISSPESPLLGCGRPHPRCAGRVHPRQPRVTTG